MDINRKSWFNALKQLINQFYLNVTPTKFFVVIAAIFGLTFLLITPPFQTPDEEVHFYRTYQISQGNLVPDNNGTVVGGMLPRSLAKTVEVTSQQPPLKFQPDVKYALHKTRVALSIKEVTGDKVLYDFSATAYYSLVSYLPQTLGILIARVINTPPVVMMYAGRLMSLIAWIILFSLAIRFMPYKKWALVAVGLLPMALFEATSLSADSMTYGLLALALALILKFNFEKKLLDIKKVVLLTTVLTLLVLSKEIMFIFLFLIFLLPSSILGNQKFSHYKRAALIAIPLLCFVGWMMTVSSLDVQNTGIFNPNPTEQIKFIIEKPLAYANVVFQTYFFTHSDGIARSFIGTFGWLDAPLSELIATIGYISLAFIFMASYGLKIAPLNRKNKLIILFTGLVYWAATTTALYLYYDPVKFKYIIGLQGRYFIPLALLAIPLLYGSWLRTSKSLYIKIAILMPLFMLISSVITIFYRYYVVTTT